MRRKFVALVESNLKLLDDIGFDWSAFFLLIQHSIDRREERPDMGRKVRVGTKKDIVLSKGG